MRVLDKLYDLLVRPIETNAEAREEGIALRRTATPTYAG